MKVQIEADDALKNRKDLMDLVTASAEFLQSRDYDPGSEAEAIFRLRLDPKERPFIGIEIREDGFSTALQLSPSQLMPAQIRELRLFDIWDRVLKYRVDKQIRRTSELIAQLED